jgi:hypothetical protein
MSSAQVVPSLLIHLRDTPHSVPLQHFVPAFLAGLSSVCPRCSVEPFADWSPSFLLVVRTRGLKWQRDAVPGPQCQLHPHGHHGPLCPDSDMVSVSLHHLPLLSLLQLSLTFPRSLLPPFSRSQVLHGVLLVFWVWGLLGVVWWSDSIATALRSVTYRADATR